VNIVTFFLTFSDSKKIIHSSVRKYNLSFPMARFLLRHSGEKEIRKNMNNCFNNKPILVIDDDPNILSSIELTLKTEGFHNVETFADSKAAIAKLGARNYSVVLVDLHMPHVSGMEIIKLLFRKEPETPVLVISGENRIDHVASCIHEGVVDYLVKPFSKQELIAAVRNAMGNRTGKGTIYKDFFLSPHFDGSRISLQDTEWRRRVEPLIQARNDYREFFDRNPIPTFVLDAETMNIKYWNNAFSSLFYLPEIPKERTEQIPFKLLVTGEDYKRIQSHMSQKGVIKDGICVKMVSLDEFVYTGSLYLFTTDAGKYFKGQFLDLTERLDYEEKLERLTKDKDMLIHALSHRVNNNLQIISSLISLEENRLQKKDHNALCRDFKGRISVIAKAHLYFSAKHNNLLYPVTSFIEDLIDIIYGEYHSPAVIKFQTDVKNASLSLTEAVPIGLILYEGLSNTLLHAFTGKKKGKVTVRFSGEKNCCLEIIDNGIGLPADFSGISEKHIGLLLIKSLAEQLEGELTLATLPSGGVRLAVYFSRI
jgi:two-component sensor histidine kinase/CheY-like chemotaxis protein